MARQMPVRAGTIRDGKPGKIHEFPTAVRLDKRPKSVLEEADFLCHLTEIGCFALDMNRPANKIRPAYRGIAHPTALSPPVVRESLYFAHCAPGRASAGPAPRRPWRPVIAVNAADDSSRNRIKKESVSYSITYRFRGTGDRIRTNDTPGMNRIL